MTTNTLRKVTLVTIVPDCKCGFIEAVADEQSFWSHEWACPYIAGFDDEDEYKDQCVHCGSTEELGDEVVGNIIMRCCTLCFIFGY